MASETGTGNKAGGRVGIVGTGHRARVSCLGWSFFLHWGWTRHFLASRLRERSNDV